MSQKAPDDDEKKFDISDGKTAPNDENLEVKLLREAVREHGKKLGELEHRFERMDDHLSNLSSLVKKALSELQNLDVVHEKTTLKSR